MAGVVERGVKKELECGICQDVFKNPKLLPCDHSFCEACLSDHIYSSVQRGGRSFKCPLCRSEIEKPRHGIQSRKDWAKHFPTDRFLASLIEAIKNYEKLHSRSTCYNHPNKKTASFCMRCMILMCQKCGKRHHESVNCRVLDIENAFQKLKPQLKTLKREFQQQVDMITSLMSRDIYADTLERSKQDALRDLEELEAKTSAFCNKVKENIKELRKSVKHGGGYQSEDEYLQQCEIVHEHLEATKQAFERQYSKQNADEILNDFQKFQAQSKEYQNALEMIASDGDIREVRLIPNKGLIKVLQHDGTVGSIQTYYEDFDDDDISIDDQSFANETLPRVESRASTVRRRPSFRPRFVLPDIREGHGEVVIESSSNQRYYYSRTDRQY